MEAFADVVRVAAVMGGESTHQRTAIKTYFANSSPPQPQVQSCRAWWTLGLGARVAFCPLFRPIPGDRAWLAGQRGAFTRRLSRARVPPEASHSASPCAICAAAAGSRKVAVPTATS